MQVDEHLVPLVLPDFDLGNEPITASVWFAKVGQTVIEGDRLLEVVIGDATVDLPSPATGVLAQRLVGEDQHLERGQILGYVKVSAEPHQH